MKLLPHILFQKCIFIIALEMASPGNRHCAICIGTLSFPITPSSVRSSGISLAISLMADANVVIMNAALKLTAASSRRIYVLGTQL